MLLVAQKFRSRAWTLLWLELAPDRYRYIAEILILFVNCPLRPSELLHCTDSISLRGSFFNSSSETSGSHYRKLLGKIVMTPTHQIESRSAGQAPEEQFRVRKRNRTALSCGPCRHRKMRCDRALPCNNCIHRDEIDGCTYTFSSVHKKNTLYTMKNTANGSPSEVQSRINHLESLVLSLMSRDKSSTDMSGRNSVLAGADQPQRANIWLPPVTTQDDARREKEEDSELDGLTSSIGSMTILQDLPVFIPATHWYTIISEIKEVKRWFEEHSMQLEDIGTQLNASSPDNEPVGVSHVSVQESPPRIAEMSSKLPAKPTCDVIMARFFETGTVDPAYSRTFPKLSVKIQLINPRYNTPINISKAI